MNKRRQVILLFSFIFLILLQSCKKPYEPPAILANNNYLVVDGFINTTPNGITTIKLSRTRNLADTVVNIPELGANIAIENKSGVFYPLGSRGSDGTYTSNLLNLGSNAELRLNIILSNGNKYISDFVRSKQTPPIDSISWIQKEDVDIYVSSNDPANNSRYYKWDFTETVQYNSYLETIWRVTNGLIVQRDSADKVNVCWKDQFNTDILIGSTAALSRDVVSLKRITTIPKNDNRLNIRYSILVRQYTLTAEAYQYWQIIQKNSEQLGTLFDLQPSQLYGNIQSVSNPNEPVVGFISASTVQQARIFINNSQLNNWKSPPANPPCEPQIIPQNPVDYRIFDFPDTSFAPWYFITGGSIAIVRKECLDCTLAGGTNKKPSFW
jgi:Domain of unknown function (DUF4249)